MMRPAPSNSRLGRFRLPRSAKQGRFDFVCELVGELATHFSAPRCRAAGRANQNHADFTMLPILPGVFETCEGGSL